MLENNNIARTSEKEVKELSDLEFINKDIIKIRCKLIDSMKKGDPSIDANTHGKWMNSLRDALELKWKLENKLENDTPKWELKCAKYKMDNNVQEISVWEQNNSGEIRSSQRFRLYDEELLKLAIDLLNQINMVELHDENDCNFKMNSRYLNLKNYLDLEGFYMYNPSSVNHKHNTNEKLHYTVEYGTTFSGDTNCKCRVYFKDSIHTITGTIKTMADYIEKLTENKDVDIYGDYSNIGMGLADELISRGFKLYDTTLKYNDINRGNDIKERVVRAKH